MPELTEVMLDVMNECNNHFINSVESGSYEVSGGALTPQAAYLPAQYVWVKGSILNDGLYKADDLGALGEDKDEAFEGRIYGLRVPRDFIRKCEEVKGIIEAQEKDGNTDPSIVSETIFKYSYTKATGENGAALSWWDANSSKFQKWDIPHSVEFLEWGVEF